jgi:general stress protein YciG
MEHSARAHPAQGGGAGHFGQNLIAERAQLADRHARRHAAVVGEGHVDTSSRQLRGHERRIAPRHAHDHAHLALARLHVRERVHVQDLDRQGGHLVGGHHPRGDTEEQRDLGRQGDRSEPPARDRAHAPRCLQHDIRRRGLSLVHGIGRRLRLVIGGEARLHMLAQLVRVVGEPHQVEGRHRPGVHARVADGQPV